MNDAENRELSGPRCSSNCTPRPAQASPTYAELTRKRLQVSDNMGTKAVAEPNAVDQFDRRPEAVFPNQSIFWIGQVHSEIFVTH